MSLSLGIIAAFIAMLCWGFGDFLIHRSTRKFGDWETLFFITLFSTIVLLPFVSKDIPHLFSFENTNFMLLLVASIILLLTGLLDFEALKQGKLAVVEPIWSFEIIISALLAFIILGERLSVLQGTLLITLMVGLVLVSLRSYHFEKRVWLEKGTFIAILAALTMGAANFFIGWGARVSNPLVMIWFSHLVICGASLVYLVTTKRLGKMWKDARKERGMIVTMSILDNAAWVAFAYALVLAPIGIAVGLSESYIIIAVLLGLIVNKEYLTHHQKLGLVIALIAAITLAATLG